MVDLERFEQLLIRERPRLVRLCALLTGNHAAAEDLAQETLLQAWTHAERLERWDAPESWLAAIARNVCRSWARARRHEQARQQPSNPEAEPALAEQLPADLDLEQELERGELATLLDRALALLPPETRAVLIGKYIAELSQRELAERLGLSETAVAVRIHRGKAAFRRILAGDLRADAAAFGLVDDTQGPWRATRIWCLDCGQARLVMQQAPPPGTLTFRCPHCMPAPEVVTARYRLANAHFGALLGGLERPTAIWNSAAAWADDYFGGALATGQARCTHCGAPAEFRQLRPASLDELRTSSTFLLVVCARCGEVVSQSFAGVMLGVPEVRRFRRALRAIQLPPQEVEIDGRPAVVTTFVSQSDAASLTVVAALDPFRILRIVRQPNA